MRNNSLHETMRGHLQTSYEAADKCSHLVTNTLKTLQEGPVPSPSS